MLHFITKLLNNFKNKFYSNKGYYFLKSGFYLDHYSKKITDKFFKEFVYYTGVVFTDFYILKKFINNFFYNLPKVHHYLLKFKNKNNLFILKITITIILCVFFAYYAFI